MPLVDGIDVSAYTIPTGTPESDGTLEWASTTLVLVRVSAGGTGGLGYTYASTASAMVASSLLAPVVLGRDALDVPAAWQAMRRAVRNQGQSGIAAMAIAAVDTALWDLKARLLTLPLAALLGRARTSVPVYGSGGFTSYGLEELTGQLQAWIDAGIRDVKMKVGRDPAADPGRVEAARDAIGPYAGLFVDANGAYTRAQAVRLAESFAGCGVTWFEEPVSSDDVAGLHALRARAPGGMEIAAGEYGYTAFDFRRLLEGQAVDVLQADATRCMGPTGFLRVAALAEAYGLPLSTHTAPALHAHLACAVDAVRHVEYFHDHVRIEARLFDGAPVPADGRLRPDPDAPGLGLTFKAEDAGDLAVYAWHG